MSAILINLAVLAVVKLFCKFTPAVDFDSLSGFTSGFSMLANIFSWVNQFVPTNLILILLTLTVSMIMVKVFWRIIDRFISIIK